MKTTDLIKAAGSVQAICAFFDIKHQAVYAWKGEVPQSRVYELMVKKPEWVTTPKRKPRKEPT